MKPKRPGLDKNNSSKISTIQVYNDSFKTIKRLPGITKTFDTTSFIANGRCKSPTFRTIPYKGH